MSLFLWISLLLLVFPLHTLAQGELIPDCSKNMPPEIAAITSPNYSAACQTYIACTQSEVAAGICQVHAFITLSENCIDALCETEAMLGAAAFNGWRRTYTTTSRAEVYPTVWQALGDGLIAFRARDLAGTLAAYQTIPVDTHFDPATYLSIGLIHDLLGDSATALNQYYQSVEYWFDDPLMYYTLGKLNARVGKTQEAAIDFYLMAYYLDSDPVAIELVESLTSTYSIDSISFEDWHAYPVLGYGGGPGGKVWLDETSAVPRPMRLGWIDNESKLVAQSISGLMADVWGYSDLPPLWILNSSDGENYSYRISFWDDYGTWGGILQFDMSAEPIHVSENFDVFESEGTSDFLIAPAAEPDPRTFFAAIRCPGAGLSRLEIGGTGYGVGYGIDRLPELHGMPALNATTTVAGHFTVIDGPQCVDNQAWWHVTTDNGDTGWISESQPYDGYFMYTAYPEEEAAIPPLCTVTMPPRLVIGGSGSVVFGLNPNNLRSEPTMFADIIGQLPEGARFEVLMGPICVGSYAWWEIRYNDLIGWTAEAGGRQYWLQPEDEG